MHIFEEWFVLIRMNKKNLKQRDFFWKNKDLNE